MQDDLKEEIRRIIRAELQETGMQPVFNIHLSIDGEDQWGILETLQRIQNLQLEQRLLKAIRDHYEI